VGLSFYLRSPILVVQIMKKLIHRHTISFRNAFSGLFWAFRTQPNFRVHGVLAVFALALGFYFHVTTTEMSILVFTIVLGISGELINTAFESMTDLITQEWKVQAKIAKDVAAGMMLFIAMGSIGVAIVIFAPYLLLLR
jgi:undecaprenol kinase